MRSPRSLLRGVLPIVLLALGGCGGGGGGAPAEPNWYYHFVCNGDQACLSTNFAGAQSGTSSQGPGQGGVSGCNGLMNFGRINWNIPPAQQWCDSTPDLSNSPFPTATISVSPATVIQNQGATLGWSSSKATSCAAADAWSGTKALSGTQAVTQANIGSYSYRITCSNANGSATSTAILTVNAAPPGVQLSVSPATITLGQSATLTWTSYQYTACTASGPWSGNKVLNGNETVTPAAAGSFTYTLSCQGAGKGSGTASVTLTVNPVSGPAPPAAPTVSLSAANEYPSCMDTGAQNTLTWSSTDASSCTASGSWTGPVATSGSQNIHPGASSASSNTILEYVLNCSGPGGSASDSVKLCVVPANSGTPPPVTLSFTVTPGGIALGESATLEWTSQYASWCSAADDWSGVQSLSGKATVTPTTSRQHVYTLTCQNYQTSKQVTVLLGVGPAPGSVPLAARFYYPLGLAADSSDNLYIANSGDHTIRRITAAGVVSTVAGQPGYAGSTDGFGTGARFNYPGGIGVGPDGKAVVGDTGGWTIRLIATDTNVTTLAGAGQVPGGSVDGTGTGARFVQPRLVSVDAAGNAFVADYGSCSIRKVTPAGVVTTVGGVLSSCGTADGATGTNRMGGVTGVAVTSSGDVYTTDIRYHTIRKIAPDGTVTTIAGTADVAGATDATGAAARFNGPYGIDVDSQGNLFVADQGNRKIRKVTPAGVVTTFAGSGSSGGADGTGTAASFYNPSGLVIDSADNIYVSDACAIRRITPVGEVTTYAGNATTCGSTN